MDGLTFDGFRDRVVFVTCCFLMMYLALLALQGHDHPFKCLEPIVFGTKASKRAIKAEESAV